MTKEIFHKVVDKLKREGFISLITAALNQPYQIYRRYLFKKTLEMDTYKARFTDIYDRNLWGSGESGSGEGSQIDYTENLRKALPIAIKKYAIDSIVDAPCGDFNWMKLVLPQVEVSYQGFDIVDSVIESNRRKYTAPGIQFEVGDICVSKLPDCDLLIVRDFLFHLSYKDVDRFLKNISELKYKYLLTSSHITNQEFTNKNITTGDFRLINIFKLPFCFAEDKVLESINDYPPNYPIKREMVLVKKDDVPIRLTI